LQAQVNEMCDSCNRNVTYESRIAARLKGASLALWLTNQSWDEVAFMASIPTRAALTPRCSIPATL
jgi:hypothetical protein